MKFVIIAIVLVSSLVNAQEHLYPLFVNIDLIKTKPNSTIQVKSSSCGLDSTFQVFSYNTLTLPVRDDFSTNKFVDYNINYTAPGVTSQLYYYILDQTNTTPVANSMVLCDSAHAQKLTTTITSGNVQTTVNNLSSGQIYTINDLCNYPIQSQQIKLYAECKVIYDTIIDGVPDSDIDTVDYASSPDFVQDSIRIFSAILSDPNKIWIDQYAYHNYTYPVNPKSLGVATLDGVGSDGYPYDWGALDTYGDADVLTSKPIDLSGKSNVYLTFFYQAKGLGNSPDEMDSLILDVYSSSLGYWQPLWSVDGNVADNEWKIVHLNINQFDLLQPDFQFRFRNKATLTGLLDHWHIDYVNLRDNSTSADTIIDDLAIMYPINTLLNDYTSVPWDHYKNLTNPNSKIKTIENVKVNNIHTAAKLQNPGGLEIDGNSFVLPVSTPNWNVGVNDYDVQIASLYTFPQSVPGDTMADFDVKLNISTSSTNIYNENDTVYYTQKFQNYYAYDDGSAETAYGFETNNAKLAVKFTAYEIDTLLGVYMKFVPSNIDVSNELFLLTIWEDNNGEPGNIIYQDSYFEAHTPNYTPLDSYLAYYRFNDDQAIVVPTTYFVGFEQINNKKLYLGMDFNNDNSNNIFYNTSGVWSNTSFPGSLIVRPVYSTAMNSVLGIDKVRVNSSDITPSYLIYPNPTNGQINIEGLQPSDRVKIYDFTGKLIYEGNSNQFVQLYDYPEGMYLICIYNEFNQRVFNQKVIKQ